MIQSVFIQEEILYTGSELSSHWIYRRTGVLGDVIASFIGGCQVKSPQMVDLEDVLAQKFIFSHRMLHILVEHFDNRDLEKANLRQRLLVCILKDILEERLSAKTIQRQGDDLFIQGKKLTISIATVSSVSSLIHLGINISSQETPVPAIGLKDLKLDPQEIAAALTSCYQEEIASIEKARCKVKPVE